MKQNELQKEEILQILEDIQCDQKTKERFMELYETGKKDEARRLLSCHRDRLMCMIHKKQKLVDILDYFLYRLG